MTSAARSLNSSGTLVEAVVHGLRILVVEDELLVALSLEAALQQFGCEVVGPISRVGDAEKMARSAPLDGAILDVNLRGHPVFPVADALAARGIPFIFATGYGAEAAPLSAYGAPRLDKPYDETALRRAMEAAFGAGIVTAAREAPPLSAGEN